MSFSTQYFGGSVRGYVSQDVVSLGPDLILKDVQFAQATEESLLFASEKYVGYRTLGPPC